MHHLPNSQHKTSSLLTGNVFTSLTWFTIPIICSMLLQTAYGLVDMLIVGQYATMADISAVSTGSQLMNVITAIGMGLSNGCAIYIGHKIGKDQCKDLGSVICQGVYMVMASGFLICGVTVVGNQEIIALLNTPTETLVETSSYILFCGIGVPMVFDYNLLNGICRGFGNSKTALVAVAISCVLNFLGDVLLVAVFGMGAKGAAIATMIAQAISVTITICMMVRKKILPVTIKRKDLRGNGIHWKRIFSIGAPLSLQMSVSSFAFLVITSIVNTFGVVESAAVGLADKVISLLMLTPIAFMSSISVFTAQNRSAGQVQRAKQGLKVGMLTSTVIEIGWSCITFAGGMLLLRLFSSAQEVNVEANEYLKAYGIDFFITSIMYCMSGYLTGSGHTFYVMVTGLFCAFCVRIPSVYLLSQRVVPFSLFATGLNQPLTTATQILLFLVFYLHCNRKRP